jgi:uncharacterized protein with PIN domain
MIVVDTSAIVAMAFGEPERASFFKTIHAAEKALISTVSVVEARMVYMSGVASALSCWWTMCCGCRSSKS